MTIFSLALLVSSFSLQSVQPTTPDLPEYLVGDWEWVETRLVARGGGSVTTPESCQCTRSLKIDAKATLRAYENGVLINESPYQVEKVEFMNDPVRYQLNSEILHGTVNRFDDGRIGIGAFGGCGHIHYYRKVREPK